MERDEGASVFGYFRAMPKVTGPARPKSALVARITAKSDRPFDKLRANGGFALRAASRSRCSLPSKHHVRRKRRALTARAGVAQGRKIYTVEQSLTGAEEYRRYGDVHLVDQVVAKILLNDVDAATHSHVLAPCCLAGALKRDDGAFCHEVEGRSSFHDKRCTCVVGQHEHRDVIDRILAPPPAPALVRPGAATP